MGPGHGSGVENFIENAGQFKNIPVCWIVGAFGKFMVEYVLAYILYPSIYTLSQSLI